MGFPVISAHDHTHVWEWLASKLQIHPIYALNFHRRLFFFLLPRLAKLYLKWPLKRPTESEISEGTGDIGLCLKCLWSRKVWTRGEWSRRGRWIEQKSKDVSISGPFPPTTVTPILFNNSPGRGYTLVLIGFQFNCPGGRRGSPSSCLCSLS